MELRHQDEKTEKRQDTKRNISRRYVCTGDSPSIRTLLEMGKNAESYLNTLSKRSRGGKGRQNASKFKDYWRKRIGIKLQQCNACVFQKKASDINSLLSGSRTPLPLPYHLSICSWLKAIDASTVPTGRVYLQCRRQLYSLCLSTQTSPIPTASRSIRIL